jgi:hypothetical protein
MSDNGFEVGARPLNLHGTPADRAAAAWRNWHRWAASTGFDAEPFPHAVHGRAGHHVMVEVLPDRPAGLGVRRTFLDG